MSNKQEQQDNIEFDDQYLDDGMDMDYDSIFKVSNSRKQAYKENSKKSARRRVEDYMERKAFRKQMKDWDNNFDFWRFIHIAKYSESTMRGTLRGSLS